MHFCALTDLETAAFICANTKRTITFGEARDLSKRFGIGLKSQWEWRKGDVMAMFR